MCSLCTMVPRHFLSSIVLIVALFATLGHVCVLPLDTHATATDTDDHDGEALHAASCEALRSTGAPLVRTTGIMVATVAITSERLCPADLRRVVASAPIVRGSPPLYLRHSALLI